MTTTPADRPVLSIILKHLDYCAATGSMSELEPDEARILHEYIADLQSQVMDANQAKLEALVSVSEALPDGDECGCLTCQRKPGESA